MPEGRPAIPAELTRAVRIEAGHRCAIPTCRATSGLEINHIIDWAESRQHAFEDLILLCANCHARVTSGEIDRKSVRAYKKNLSLLAGRYSDLERRVLERFVKDDSLTEVTIDVGHAVLLDYLVADGLIEYGGPSEGAIWVGDDGDPKSAPAPGQLGPATWRLTESGREFVDHLRRADELR